MNRFIQMKVKTFDRIFSLVESILFLLLCLKHVMLQIEVEGFRFRLIESVAFAWFC